MILSKKYELGLLLFFASFGNICGSIVNWYLGKKILIFQSKKWFPVNSNQLDKSQKIFNKYGFSDWKALSKLLDGQSGKKLLSKTHTLIKNRQVLILFSNDLPTATSQKIESHNDIAFIENLGCHLKIDKVSVLDLPDTNTIYVDFDKLQFPLELRPWKNGDYFYPKGMEGKKKISKFFKDEKMSLSEKDKTLLLCSDAQVVWVVGKRQDARFIASETDALMCKISLQYATD